MKKIFLVFLLIGIVLLVGCKQAAEPEIEEKPTETGPDVTIIDQETEPKDTATVVQPEPKRPLLSKEIQAIIDKAESITSLEYDYNKYIPDKGKDFMHVLVKGDLIKQEISLSTGTFFEGTRLDTAYINTAEKTVEAYCENTNRCEFTDVKVAVDYDDFVLETPLTVLERVTSGEITGSELIDNRETTIIQFTNADGKTERVWLWEFKGVPLRYEISQGDEVEYWVDYEKMTVNQLKDSDLVK